MRGWHLQTHNEFAAQAKDRAVAALPHFFASDSRKIAFEHFAETFVRRIRIVVGNFFPSRSRGRVRGHDCLQLVILNRWADASLETFRVIHSYGRTIGFEKRSANSPAFIFVHVMSCAFQEWEILIGNCRGRRIFWRTVLSGELFSGSAKTILSERCGRLFVGGEMRISRGIMMKAFLNLFR